MKIVLFRNGHRALILFAEMPLDQCPPALRAWLGPPRAQHVAELTLDTPMPGIHPFVVLGELLEKGFCACDTTGSLHLRDAPALPGSATDLLQMETGSPGNPRG